MSSKIIDIDVKSYPCHGLHPTMILLTVLVQRVEGTFKAYAAIVPDTSRDDPNYEKIRPWVHSHGNPVRAEQAERIWPDVKGKYAA